MIKETEHQLNSNVIEFRSRVKKNSLTEFGEIDFKDQDLASEIAEAIDDQFESDELFIVLDEDTNKDTDKVDDSLQKISVDKLVETDFPENNFSDQLDNLDDEILEEVDEVRNLSDEQNHDSHLSRYLTSLRSEHRRDFLTFTAAVILVCISILGVIILFQDLEGDAQAALQSSSPADTNLQPAAQRETSSKLKIKLAEPIAKTDTTQTPQPNQTTSKETKFTSTTELMNVANNEATKPLAAPVQNTPVTTSEKTNELAEETQSTNKEEKIEQEETEELETIVEEPEIQINYVFTEDVDADSAEIQISTESENFCASSYEYILTDSKGDQFEKKVGVDQNNCSDAWIVNLVALIPGESYTLDFLVFPIDGTSKSKRIEWTH